MVVVVEEEEEEEEEQTCLQLVLGVAVGEADSALAAHMEEEVGT